MAGVYTDNQPDFSFLAPWETKTFSQYWYPIREIGPAQMANRDAALSLRPGSRRRLRIRRLPERRHPPAARRQDRRPVDRRSRPRCALRPRVPQNGRLRRSRSGRPRVDPLHRRTLRPRRASQARRRTPAPKKVATNDELYQIALHLDQYRHATRFPEDYWREALRRDPGDARAHNAMGRWHLRRGEFKRATVHFGLAIETLTRLNANPYDGEPYYNLGLALRYLGFDDEAYVAFYKATWNYAWRTAGYTALAEIDAKRERWETALEHLALALRTDADHVNARNLQAAILRRLGRDPSAIIREALALDPLNVWTRHLADGCVPSDPQLQLDLAFDYLRAGLNREAASVLTSSHPMVLYTRGELRRRAAREAGLLLPQPPRRDAGPRSRDCRRPPRRPRALLPRQPFI